MLIPDQEQSYILIMLNIKSLKLSLLKLNLMNKQLTIGKQYFFIFFPQFSSDVLDDLVVKHLDEYYKDGTSAYNGNATTH